MKSSGENSTYAFVDGSFNKATHTYGYGGFLVTEHEKYVLQGQIMMPRWPQCAT